MKETVIETKEIPGTSRPHSVYFSPDLQEGTSSDFKIQLDVLDGDPHEQTERSGTFVVHKGEKGISTLESQDELWIRIERNEDANTPLEEVSFSAYQDLFTLLQDKTGNLVRIWNYVPNILDEQGDLERYRRFNIGRKKAWEAYGPKAADGELLFPAATGIGSLGGGLRIEAMFSKHPVIYLQNPRQTPPVQYSDKYGPRPPVFARGAILLGPDRHEFFVSGTASILGEDVVHVGDPVLQTEETLRNIETLISRENCLTHGYDGEFAFSDIQNMRVYVKHPEHLAAIKEVVEKRVSAPVLYLHDDICRSDLLVEIECVCVKNQTS